MLKQFDANTLSDDKTLLGNALPSKTRIDSIMDLIDAEPSYTGAYEGAGHKVLPFKKLAIAAALMLALLFTPFNGTSFAGELLNWTQEILIQNQVGFIEGEDKLILGFGGVEAPDTSIDNLEDLELVFESHGYDYATVPKGYSFQKAEVWEDLDPYYKRILVSYNDPQGALLSITLTKTHLYKPEYSDKSYFGTKVSGHGLEFTEVDFLNEKAMLIKMGEIYDFMPPIVLTQDGEKHYGLQISMNYSSKVHEAEWAEGKLFLEQWYQRLQP